MAYEEVKKRALRMLDRRDYGRDELIGKLREKGEDPDEAAAAVDALEALGLIDDVRYAALVVRHAARKGYGRARVQNELYRRKIPRELWEDALAEMPEMDETLDRLLRSKLRGSPDDRDALRRATEALRRRGFGWTEIHEAVERLSADWEEQ